MKLVKKIFKVLGIILGLVLIVVLVMYFNKVRKSNKNMELLGEEAPVLVEQGQRYRDLN
ncbi:MAG: hypothetical protein HKN89_03605, partial [Eudoraea sp.]|nr:hypothetical protein [Eudoraea sp.]